MAHATTIVTHFRRLPSLTRGAHDYSKAEYPSECQERCDKVLGHTLIIQDNRIICACCGATWKDEGF